MKRTQRGVDLVHDVQGRGAEVVQRKHQRQRGQRFLPAGQVGDVLPRLLRGPHAEDDALLPIKCTRSAASQVSCDFKYSIQSCQLMGLDVEPS